LPVRHGAYYYQGALIASTGGLNDGKNCYCYVPYNGYFSVLEDRPILVRREEEASGRSQIGRPSRIGRLPVRIKVLEVEVPADNPYDIGTEKTLEALRRSGVLTKSGKLGKLFR